MVAGGVGVVAKASGRRAGDTEMVRLVVKAPELPSQTALACFDGIVDGRAAWEFDLDEALALRSVYAFLADAGRLGQEALGQLAVIDQFWRAHPAGVRRGICLRACHAGQRAAGWVCDRRGWQSRRATTIALVVATVGAVVTFPNDQPAGLTYDGPALQAHTMDVRLLAPALLAFGDLAVESARAL